MRYFLSCMLLLVLTTGAYASSLHQSTIKGVITDAETGEAVPFAYIHLEEINRIASSSIDGEYELRNIPEGTYTFSVHRIGYRTQSQIIVVGPEELKLNVKMVPSILSAGSIQVIGDKSGLEGSNLEHASKNILGSDLRRNLGATISKTLSNLPGFDQRTQGGAPGRPVIRGLGNERVLILQDGIRTGDVSATSGDHAVSVDPAAAQEIEIARGPAALAYGANAIGGVINVVKNQIATTLPSNLSGSFTAGTESVNSQLSGAANISVPLGNFALTSDVTARTGLDTGSPQGRIRNSFFNSTNDNIGLSYVQDWGYIGGSVGIFATEYGIPPNPIGEPEGVNIEAFKYQLDLKSEILLRNSPFKLLEFTYSFKDFTQDEIERAGRGAIGTSFDLLTHNASIRTQHNQIGFLDQGRLGLWFETEDLVVFGDDTPPSNSYKLGAYIIEEKDFGGFHLEAGLRFDYVQNRPDRENPNSDIGFIRSREFTSLASSGALFYNFGGGFSAGASILHSFRAPSLSELFSEGPHLATFTFELGNPNLDAERGLAKEFILRYSGNKVNTELTFFHNGFSNFLFARNTGVRNNQRADLFNFQFEGAEAQLYGVETAIELQLSRALVFSGNLSYTIADRELTTSERIAEGTSVSDRSLPQIPPLKVNLGLRYAKGNFEVGTKLRLAAEQNRTDQFEAPTGAYEVLNAFVQYRITKGNLLHTFSLNATNITNATYRNHLSLIKDTRPEAGQNISLLYRVFF